MRNNRFHLPWSPVAVLSGTVGILAVVYIALIAVVMSYAALTISFSQSVRDDDSAVATLEGQYLAAVARITATDYSVEGYAAPVATVYVPSTSATALR